MNSLVYLFAMISTSAACTCIMESANQAYCRADFVAHVRVENPPKPYNNQSGEHSTIYVVDFVKVYKKKPPVCTLSPIVYTSSIVGACGLLMQVGKEYLLSGFNSDGTQHVSFCGQVRDEGYGGVSEWKDVSSELKKNLTLFQC